MGVYYKFKSAKDYDSVPLDGHFISVGQLKERIFELKHLGGTDYDLIVTNAQTNEEYLDEGMLIPKNTSVLIRRVPGLPRKRIVAVPVTEQPNSVDVEAVKVSSDGNAQDLEWDDEFGNDIYAMPETTTTPVPSSSIPMPVSKEEEESRIKALIENSALDWQRPRIPMPGFVRNGFLKKAVPAHGYVCRRCKVPGHFIQHCPTNGDPNFDIKRVVPPTGIPKSMLMATPDGSYTLSSGAAGVLKPNEAAFEKEIEGMPSTARSIRDIPRELHCPLCQQVMKYAVLASRCCLKSFCDKCIRDHLLSKSMCECGATGVLADHLLPNKTLRDTINRILESNNSSTQSAAASKEKQVLAPTTPPQQEEIPKVVEENKHPANEPLKSEKDDHSRTVKEAACAPLAGDEEEGQQKKRKKICMQPENYMMPMGPSAFNHGWNGMQPGFDGFMPYHGAAPPMPYLQFGGFLPYDPFAGIPSYGGPQRDLSELVGFNFPPPPIMNMSSSNQEFEADDLKRKHRRDEREGSSTVNVSSRSKSNSSLPPSGADRRPSPERLSSNKKSDHQHRRREYHEDRERDHHHHRSNTHHRRSESPTESPAAAEKKLQATVFSRISFPAEESISKKRQHEEVYHDSGDDERHFKRRPSRYTSARCVGRGGAPPPLARVGGQ